MNAETAAELATSMLPIPARPAAGREPHLILYNNCTRSTLAACGTDHRETADLRVATVRDDLLAAHCRIGESVDGTGRGITSCAQRALPHLLATDLHLSLPARL